MDASNHARIATARKQLLSDIDVLRSQLGAISYLNECFGRSDSELASILGRLKERTTDTMASTLTAMAKEVSEGDSALEDSLLRRWGIR